MQTRMGAGAALCVRALLAVAFAAGLAACGEESPAAALAGTYATDAVQAELEEHEREFFSDDLHGRADSIDKAEASEEGAVWARLRLRPDGRFEYEGPVVDEGTADARLRGRWTARAGIVDLVVENASDEAEHLPKRMSCPATPEAVELPFLKDPSTRRPLRLSRR
jgi:hypothetical protein